MRLTFPDPAQTDRGVVKYPMQWRVLQTKMVEGTSPSAINEADWRD